MKILLLILSLVTINVYGQCGNSAGDSGINTLITDGCSASNSNDVNIILDREIKVGEEVNSESLNLKFAALNFAVNSLIPVNVEWITFGTAVENFTLTDNKVEYTTGSNNPYSIGAVTTKTTSGTEVAHVSFKANLTQYLPVGFDSASDVLSGQEFPEYGVFLQGTNYQMIKKSTWSGPALALPNGFDTVIKLAIEENAGIYEFVTYFDGTEIDRTEMSLGANSGTAPFRFLASLGYAGNTVEVLEISGFN